MATTIGTMRRGLRITTGSLTAFLLAAGLLAAPAAMAQDTVGGGKAESPKPETAKAAGPRNWTLAKTGTFGGKTLSYTVVAGETRLKNDKGEETASIFSTAYLKADAKDTTDRPVTFLFNGGPGSASVWLHMGVFGPRRIAVPGDGGSAGAPPFPIVDNPDTILDVTDLVFIDPVGTGYSHVVGKGEENDFFGVEEDARAVAQFIRQWLTDNKRWNSPKYMGGESYGAIRTAAVARELSRATSWVSLNGLLLISGAVDFGTLDFSRGNDESYISFLPSYAATAWYHGKVPRSGSFEDFVERARTFAIAEYAPALLKGNRLTEAERMEIARKLAGFTGLSEEFIRRADLRIAAPRFQKELLRAEGMSVGRFDARYKGDDYDDAGETFDNDPSLYGIAGAYTTSVNHYFLNELGIDMGREYKVLTSIGANWNWRVGQNSSRNGHLNVGPWIGQAMRENPALRTHVAGGYYDLATPFFAKENVLNGTGVPTERIVFDYYHGGHMMYVHEPSLKKLTDDIRRFIANGNRPAG